MTCELCGGPLRRDNKYGVCSRKTRPDCVAEWHRRRYKAQSEAYRERCGQYRREHPEMYREACRRYYYRHPGASQERNRHRRARETALPTESIDKSLLWDRQKGLCGICLKPMVRDDTHLDHIIPIASGKGGHVYCNVQLTHPQCNLSKHCKVDWKDSRIQAILAECETFKDVANA